MTDPRTTGATAAEGEKKTNLLWLWILLAVIIVGLLLWWLISALTGDDDADATGTVTTTVEETETETETTATATATETPSATASPGDATPTAGVGMLVVGAVEAFAPGTDLTQAIGEPAVANAVQIQAVVADEAFYVGPSDEQAVLVRLEPFAGPGEPESPTVYEEGDTVSFSGTAQEIDQSLLDSLQLYDPAEDINPGDVYIQADEITVEG